MNDLLWRTALQLQMAPPGVEVGCVRLHVLVMRAQPVRMEDELVRREEQAAVRTLDAFGTRRVVARRRERSRATPGTLVVHTEGEPFW